MLNSFLDVENFKLLLIQHCFGSWDARGLYISK